MSISLPSSPSSSPLLTPSPPASTSSLLSNSFSQPLSPLSPLIGPEQQASQGCIRLPIEYVSGLSVARRARDRRCSVSAECSLKGVRPVPDVRQREPKSAAQIERIAAATRSSILFAGLDKDQQREIIESMSEFLVQAGQVVIRQREEGDFFYVIERGIFDVYKDEQKVFEYINKGSFGELALMYNCPRAATIIARTDGCLWRTDRETFRYIVIASTAKKRSLLESALESVPLLANLSKQERALIADALETITFVKGDHVIKQGEIGESMYFIIKGEASATQTSATNRLPIQVGRLKEGDYFGERALLTREPRAANVIVTSPELQVAVMDLSAFERLLGSVREIMTRQMSQYLRAEDVPDET